MVYLLWGRCFKPTSSKALTAIARIEPVMAIVSSFCLFLSVCGNVSCDCFCSNLVDTFWEKWWVTNTTWQSFFNLILCYRSPSSSISIRLFYVNCVWVLMVRRYHHWLIQNWMVCIVMTDIGCWICICRTTVSGIAWVSCIIVRCSTVVFV